jgi:hypothetical protein
MESRNKFISLSQASKISGYHQDYLSSLIRKKEIKGEKIGGNWLTTEEEVRSYIFKQKIRHKKWLVRYFLYFKELNKSFIYAFVLLAFLSVGLYFYNKNHIETKSQTINTSLSNISKPEIKEEFKELKF